MLHAGDASDPPVQLLERVERRPCGRPGPSAVAWRQSCEGRRPVRAPSALDLDACSRVCGCSIRAGNSNCRQRSGSRHRPIGMCG